MSRSRRKPFIKDAPRNAKKSTLYWRRVRSRIKNSLRSQHEELPHPKEIVNDYDYSDYTFVPENMSEEQRVRYSRK